jgi:hypothetical protein
MPHLVVIGIRDDDENNIFGTKTFIKAFGWDSRGQEIQFNAALIFFLTIRQI